MPYLHAAFSGQEAIIDLTGAVIEGGLSKSKMRLLLAWIEIRRDAMGEPEADWNLLCSGEPVCTIEPLK